MKALMFMKHIFRKFPLLLSTNVLLLFGVGVLEAVSIFALIPIIDFLIKPGLEGASHITQRVVQVMGFIGLPVTLIWLLAIFLLFNVLKSGFQIFAQHSILKTKYTVLRNIMVGTFEDFFNARWYFFSSGKQGTLLNTFLREINIVGDAFGVMARFFAKLLQTAFYFAVPLYLSWKVTLVCLAIAMLFALPFLLLGKINYKWGKLNTSTGNQIGAAIQENLVLAKVVLGFGNQRKSVEALENAFDEHRKVTVKSQTLNFATPFMYYPLGIFVLMIGMLVARKLTLPLSEATVLLYSFLKALPAVGDLLAQKNSFDGFFPSYEQVLHLRHHAKELKQLTGNKTFNGFNNELSIDRLSFGYTDNEPTLMDIDVRIPKGSMIAFVGESGAGKSTLIDMVMGFNQPDSGRITLDNIPLHEFDIKSYRQRLGYVPQESILFNATIRDNLRWAKQGATDAEIKEACRQANAEEFIEKFPKRYDTLVGDRGVRLSGGQIQRIALARAILRKPQLLILDEATSALDTNSERLIQQAIETITKETTVIVIAHRLSTIVNADYIYVLKEGRVVEEGPYSALIGMNGDFSQMVRQQELEVIKEEVKEGV